MKRAFTRSFHVLTALFGLIALSVVHADSVSRRYRLVGVEFKSNGRIEKNVIADCDVKQQLASALGDLLGKSDAYRKKPATDMQDSEEMLDVELRIDRVIKLPFGSVGAGFGGNELAVTAIVSGQNRMVQQFYCRGDFGGFAARATHCQRIQHCSDKLAKDVSAWLQDVVAN